MSNTIASHTCTKSFNTNDDESWFNSDYDSDSDSDSDEDDFMKNIYKKVYKNNHTWVISEVDDDFAMGFNCRIDKPPVHPLKLHVSKKLNGIRIPLYSKTKIIKPQHRTLVVLSFKTCYETY